MSSGLMSCVRENSPPLDLDASASGPLSLPETSTRSSVSMLSATSTPLSTSHNEAGGVASASNGELPSKRRRFLRNLRNIFRRRTITSVVDTPASGAVAAIGNCNTLPPPTSSTSEKNLRSATLSSIHTLTTASSPCSPLTQSQLHEAYTLSLPKSASYSADNSSGCAGEGVRSGKRYAFLGVGKSKQHKKQKERKEREELAAANAEVVLAASESERNMYTTASSAANSAMYYNPLVHHQPQGSLIFGGKGGGESGVLRQSLGVAVLPNAMTRSIYTERLKLRSIGDSSQDLDSSGNDSGSSKAERNAAGGNGNNSAGEMSDSQRSLSEGRLVDSDYSRDGLSQSHDSVFSESATASSLSSVLKAELANVLSKRNRNRPDASDEDLGLPRSPASPPRRNDHFNKSALGKNSTTNRNEISSLSMLSMNSSAEGEDGIGIIASTANNSVVSESLNSVSASRYSRSSMLTTKSMNSDILRSSQTVTTSYSSNSLDETDWFQSSSQNHQPLSHSAAKHKMAIRPIKKKGPSRHHRRTLESSIPEANEDLVKLGFNSILDSVDHDSKAKTRSLPPGVNAKQLEQHAETKSSTAFKSTPINDKLTKQSKPEITSTNTTTSSSMFGFRSLTAKASSIFETKESSSVTSKQSVVDSSLKKKDSVVLETPDSGFLRRIIQRNSKRNISKANAEDDLEDMQENQPKKLQISTSMYDTKVSSAVGISDIPSSKSAMNFSENLEEKRKEIKREIMEEGRTGLSAMLNNFMATEKSSLTCTNKEAAAAKEMHKPKSGPAARQRYEPLEIGSISNQSEVFQSTSLVREVAAAQQTSSQSSSKTSLDHHFEKKPKIVGLSPFQQKISRSNDAVTRSSINSLDDSSENLQHMNFERKHRRKSVEKSRSFRSYNEETKDSNQTNQQSGVHNNMPSLPDLSLNLRVPYYSEFILKEKDYSSPSPPAEHNNDKSVSLGFEINDNSLIKPNCLRSESAHNLPQHPKSTPNKFLNSSGVIVPNLSPGASVGSCNKNISEIEQNIDMIVKSPYVSVLRKANGSDAAQETLLKTVNYEQKLEIKRPNELPLKANSIFAEKLTPSKSSDNLLKEIKSPQYKSTSTSTEKQYFKSPNSPAVKTAAECFNFKSQFEREPKSPQNNNKLENNCFSDSPPLSRESKLSPQFKKKWEANNYANSYTNSCLDKELKSPQMKTPTDNLYFSSPISSPEKFLTTKQSKETFQPSKQHSPLDDMPLANKFNHNGRPQILNLQERQLSLEKVSPISPVNLREKTKITTNSLGDSGCVTAIKSKESERKSAPAAAQMCPTSPVKTTNGLPNSRRSSALVEGEQLRACKVPEFLKVHLNKVDSGNMAKSNVVLAKNVQVQRNSTKDVERSASTDDLSLRRYSNESVEINEHEETQSSSIFEAINTQTKAISSNSLRGTGAALSNMDKSPIKNNENSFVRKSSISLSEETERSLHSPKLSLQERKQLFLIENRHKEEKKLQELRNERKKSITEELLRKSQTDIRETLQQPKNEPTTAIAESSVVLRKKPPIPSNGSISMNGNSNTATKTTKDDATPELMKVFMRRSLKVKDEDIQALTDKIMGAGQSAAQLVSLSGSQVSTSALKKLNSASPASTNQQNVDSDKENQSASEEKLDKLTKYDVSIEQTVTISKTKDGNENSNHINRNTVADFRNGALKHGQTVSNGNHQKSWNNNACPKPYVPPSIKFSPLRNSMISESSLNNNNGKTLNNNSSELLEAECSSNKAIERSATVSEFKGIHQRRAEWEQRAKNAFK